MKSKLNELKNIQSKYQTELEELHIYEPSQEYYKMRRDQIEYIIASLESEIEFEKKMIPFKIMLYSFMIIATCLLMWGILFM